MDKSEGNIDQQSVSKAVAHNVEAADVIFATAYQEPPPLFTVADPKNKKEEVEREEETAEKESQYEVSAELTDVETPDPVGQNEGGNAAMIKGAVAPEKESPEEELVESPDTELVFADAPSDDGSDEDKGEGTGGAGGGAAGGSEDNPIQNKNSADSVSSPLKSEEEEEQLQLKTKEEEESIQLKTSPSLAATTDTAQLMTDENSDEPVETSQFKGLAKEELEEESEQLKLKDEVVQHDSNLDLLEAGGHPRRNQHNELPVGLLVPADGSSNPHFEYREGQNVFIDEAGRYWTMLSDEQNVYHQPPEVVNGFFDNQFQKLSHWWNETEREPFPNKKFISDDGDTGGSFEAILQPNSDGTYSTNWLNSGSQQGTYNFYSPEGVGGNVGHFFFDILPHFANDNYDPSPTQEKTSGIRPSSDKGLSDKSTAVETPADVMAKMEASFGTSFSDVSIHTNSTKAEANGALAFAKGNEIHFAPGTYQPETKKGQELLGHELAHVVQQKQGRVKPTTYLNNGTAINDDPELEKEADVLGAKAASFSLSEANPVSKKAIPDRFSNIVQRQVPEESPSPIPPEGGLDGFTPEQIAQAEAELNASPAPAAPFKKVVEIPPPPKKEPKKAPKIKLPKNDVPAAAADTKKGSGAPKAFSPPTSSVSAEGRSIRSYLDAASQPALDEGKTKARGLETNERRNEGAMVKTSNAKKAVVAPPGEDQSRKDGDKTRKTAAKETPEVRKDKANSEFEKSLNESLPTKIKDVEKFKGSSKARQITDKAKKVIAEDKDLTTDTYNSVVRTEFILANENDNPIPLGPIEEAEITAPFDIADKIVPDLQPLKAKFEGSTTEVEAKMAEQGATAENMALAKSSKLDTFKADKSEFTTLETNLDSTLDGIYQEGAEQTSAKFQEAEEQGRTDMRKERESKLDEAHKDQENTTSDLEKKRLEIVKNIEDIYSPVEKKVNERLQKLDETTRIEFENGMNDATKEFEDNVNTRFKAFKKKRYKGFWGPAKWLKDKLLGVNKLQEVKDILSSEKENYEKNIDKLIEDITGRNKQVIELCKREINEAKVKIDEYIDSLPDALKEIARDASKVIKEKLIALEDAVKEKEKELENLLGELRQEAMDWVEAKIEEYNEKWGGVLGKILEFLADIALEILRGLLNAAGVDGDTVINIVKDTIKAVIAIIQDPIGFFKNLMAIVKGGFQSFFSGTLKNLFSAFLEWLTGSGGTIVFPTEWTLKNILMMLLDFFGLGWESIKGYFAEELGPQVVDFAVGAFELIQAVVDRGPDAILEFIEAKVGRVVEGGWSNFKDKYGDNIGTDNIDVIEMFSDLMQRIKSDGFAGIWDFIKENGQSIMKAIKDAVMDAIIDFAKSAVITAGINALLQVATGIIGAIVAVYNIVRGFLDNLGTLGALVGAILKSVIHAAFGAISAGIDMVFSAIKLVIAAVLNFLCRLLGLGDIPGQVQKAIGSIIDKVQEFVKGIVKWISDKLKAFWEKLKDWWNGLFGDDEEETGEGEEDEEGDFPTDFSHDIAPLNGKGMDSKGGGFNFPWGGSSGDYDFGGSPYGGGENARSVDLQKGEMMGAEEDAEFQAEMTQLTNKAEEQKEHETTDQKVEETVAAAESPSNEVNSKAKSKQVDKMGEEDAGEFKSDDFKRQLLDKVDSIAPSDMDGVMAFKSSGKASALKSTIATDVSDAGKETKKDIEETTKEAPDTSGFETREHTPLPPEPLAPDRGAISKDKAAIKKQPDEVFVSPIEEEKTALEQQYTDAEITDEQLTAANEPTFTAALDSKNTAMTTMDSSIVDMRAGEEEIIQKSQGEAQTEGDEKLDAFLETHNKEVGNVAKQQTDTKSKDEAERKKVADHLESIYTSTKSKVEAKLAGIDATVNSMFDSAADTAKVNFENYVDTKMREYKDARYSGAVGAARWVKDAFLGLPSEVNQFYVQARDLYVAEMDRAVVAIADYVTGELNAAKQIIASGKDDINKYVDNLDPNLQKFAKEAATNIAAKFTALEETVAAKQTELIDNLAQKYTDNLGEIDTKIDEMMASNEGLIQKAVDSVTSVIETINNMRNMLTSVINDGLAVVNEILKHPIQFLSNLIQGVSAGFNQFATNIGSHLQDGLSGWLFGTLGEAGIEIPSSFDLGGILSIITQVVGLTWNYIRARIVNFIGEENMERLETTVEMFQAFRRDGVKGFKEAAAEEGAEMKETVIGEIKSFVIQEVVQKGIIWILSLFNPASAFVKACMAIYDIVIFFVNRGAQIAELVQSVLGAISAVVAGNVSAMAGAIEGTLSRALPLAIGFLANLLGLGGLATKVKTIIKKAQAPVNKVVDKVVGKARNLAGKFTGKDDDDEDNENGEKDEKWDKGVESLIRLQTSASNKGKTEKQMSDALAGIKSTHDFDRLTKSAEGDFWEVKAKKGDKRKTLDIKADFEGKEQGDQAADPEVEAKAQEGFAELRAKAAKFEGEGATKEEADEVVADVKRKHEVFEVLQVVGTNSADGWDVKFKYNPEGVKANVIEDKEDQENILAIDETFVIESGEQHRLYFSGSNDDPILMVASTPTRFDIFISTIEVSDDLKSDKANARKIAEEIDRLVEESLNSDDIDNSQKIDDKLSVLAPLVAKLMGGGAPAGASSTPSWSTGPGGFGASMTIDYLTGTTTGSAASAAGNATYDTLNKRRSGNGSYYVRGHLLSESLHGTGKEWQNLTPLSRSGNSLHESMVESKLKGAIPPEGSGGTRAFRYVVIANYGRGVDQTLIQAIDASTEDDATKSTKKDIVRAEAMVPTALVCTIQEVDPTDRTKEIAGALNGTTTVPNVVDQSSAGAYQLSGESKPEPVKINSDTEEIIEQRLNISSKLSEAIVDERDENGSFSSGINLANRVNGLNANQTKSWYEAGLIKYST